MKKILKRQFTSALVESISYREGIDAEERRNNGEWALDAECPEIGLRAHALYNYLVSEGEITPLTEEEKNRKRELEIEIQRLNSEYDEKETADVEILNKIEDLEDEKDTIEDYDVYSIIPDGEYYELTAFKVAKPGLEDRRYTVGDEDEMDESARDNIRDYLKSEGYDGFNRRFVESNIDEDKVYDFAYDYLSEDVYQNPEVYIAESRRELSKTQEEKIRILEMRIEMTEEEISKLVDLEDEGYNVKSKINDLENLIEDFEYEKTEIEENPDGDFPDEIIDEKISELANDAQNDAIGFLRNHGLEVDDFIDEDAFITAALEEDGNSHFLNNYDGSYETILLGNNYYDIMRIE